MGRPNLADERIPQILDAFERCIIQYGLAGSSLPVIAREAGMRHSMIRHYIGNRDDLVGAMVSRFADHYLGLLETAITRASEQGHMAETIEFLFRDVSLYDTQNTIFFELFSESPRNGNIREILMDLYRNVLRLASRMLMTAYPEAREAQAESLSYALLSLWFGHTSLMHLGFGEASIPSATNAANQLVSIFNPPKGDPE